MDNTSISCPYNPTSYLRRSNGSGRRPVCLPLPPNTRLPFSFRFDLIANSFVDWDHASRSRKCVSKVVNGKEGQGEIEERARVIWEQSGRSWVNWRLREEERNMAGK